MSFSHEGRLMKNPNHPSTKLTKDIQASTDVKDLLDCIESNDSTCTPTGSFLRDLLASFWFFCVTSTPSQEPLPVLVRDLPWCE